MKISLTILFDASIRKDSLGVGIYDSTNQIPTSKKFKIDKNCSLIAETMALACAMEYASEKYSRCIHLFTDNMQLYKNGIPERFIKRYPNKEFNLFWVPRELNKEADELSKEAHIEIVHESEFMKMVSNFSLEKRLELINQLCKNKNERKLFNILSGVTNATGKVNIKKSSGIATYIYFCKNLIQMQEVANTSKSKDKLKVIYANHSSISSLSEEEIDKFVETRLRS